MSAIQTDHPGSGQQFPRSDSEVLESIGDAFYALDDDWRFIYVNRRAEEFWDRRREDLLGKRIWDEFPQIAGSEAHRQILKSASERVPAEFEAQSALTDKWLEVRVYPSSFGLSVYFRDVTRRKKLQDAHEALLREASESRAFLSSVIEQMPSGVIIAEAPSGKLLYGNARVAEIWRHDYIGADGVDGYGEFRGFHRDGRPYEPHEWPLARSVSAGEVVEHEQIRILRGDGTYGFIEISAKPIRNEAGDVTAAVAVFHDITERKRIEAALLASEEGWRWLADSMPAHVTLAEPDGSISYVNKRWLDFTGAPMEEGLGQGWHTFIHPDDLPKLAAEYVKSVQEQRELEMEFRVRNRDGEYCWFFARMIPVSFDETSALKWISISLDITDRKQAADERERLVQELHHANSAKDEFLGHVSHELKSPITTIVGNAEVLLRLGTQLDPDALKSSLIDVQREAERLNHLIDDLLPLARLEQGADQEMEPLMLNRVIARVIDGFRERYPARRIDAHLGPDVIALGDQMYVEQLLRNLLSNAVKYSPAHEPIDVHVSGKDDCVDVRVLDRGPGLTEEEAREVFTAFYRVPRLAQRAPGIGVGLAVSKRLAEAQNGNIWTEPRPGGGCEFGFSLPRASDLEA